MSDNQYVLEVAIFTVKAEYMSKMPALRNGLREALQNFPGMLELETCSPLDDSRVFADICKWETLENAKAAAKAFENGDERFLPYMEAIEEIKFMAHFKP